MADRAKSKVTVLKEQSIVRILYIITVFSMALTGFGQMPIYKRYYLADQYFSVRSFNNLRQSG